MEAAKVAAKVGVAREVGMAAARAEGGVVARVVVATVAGAKEAGVMEEDLEEARVVVVRA